MRLTEYACFQYCQNVCANKHCHSMQKRYSELWLIGEHFTHVLSCVALVVEVCKGRLEHDLTSELCVELIAQFRHELLLHNHLQRKREGGREGDAQTDRHTGKKKTKVSQNPSVLRRVCWIYWHSRVRLYTQIWWTFEVEGLKYVGGVVVNIKLIKLNWNTCKFVFESVMHY